MFILTAITLIIGVLWWAVLKSLEGIELE